MASAQPLTDHNRIREWAEARGARPACVKGTGGKSDTGMIRLDFPGYTGSESLQEISWDEWFQRFDENNLALIVQDTPSRGQKSNFNKLVSRGTASARTGARTRAAGTRQARPTSKTRGAAKQARGTKKTQTAGREIAAAADRTATSSGRKTTKRSGTRTLRARRPGSKRS